MPHISDLLLSIVLRCSAKTLVRVASLLPSVHYNRVFWTNYLNADNSRLHPTAPKEQQERLHKLLVACAENNHAALFEDLWQVELLGEGRRALIKERRSLHRAFERAFHEGHKETAWRIFKIDEQWIVYRYLLAR